MTVADLKGLLSKLPPDCDDLHVVLTVAHSGQNVSDLLVGTGYIPMEETTAIALVGMSEIHRRVQSGEMLPPDGYFPPLPGDEWKQG